MLPLAFIAALAAFLALPRIHDSPILTASFAGAVAVLLVWYALLWRRTRARGTRLKIDISLRPQHYLQAIAHTSIFVYWGMYWPPIQDAAVLIAAQIVFVYAFDILLSWTRKDEFVLGFGPFPIIYSTNLFLRFRDDWFYLQFLMVAVGFLAKELIRWQRDGKRVHIFNPSSFPLALFSLVLIVTNSSDITWAEGIATQLILPPYIYLFIFLVALPGQFLFGVTTMTLPAVLTTYLFSEAYFRLTGTYFFLDSHVPIAVFLGMHLLFTDPSTAPRTEAGRILFGVAYGASVVLLYVALGAFGAPTYYDKLLQVPILNLLVQRFDRVALTWRRASSPASPLSRRRRLIYVSIWAVAFAGMSRVQGVGHFHPGQSVVFWQTACAENRAGACAVATTVFARDCGAGSPWACNELGIVARNADERQRLFQSACIGGVAAACQNVRSFDDPRAAYMHADPRLSDYAIVLRAGRGDIPERTPIEIFSRACSEGFPAGCGSLGDEYFLGATVTENRQVGATWWQKACDQGHAMSCSNLAVMHRKGDAGGVDNQKAIAYMQRACDLGMANACRLVQELK